MYDCKSCKEKRRIIESVPYICHESDMARMERTIKRLWILLVLMAFFLIGTNSAWVWRESQFEDVVTVTQENSDGYNNYVWNNGDISNG